jgi:hypothetical protein
MLSVQLPQASMPELMCGWDATWVSRKHRKIEGGSTDAGCHRCFPRREATGAREPVKPVIEITAKVAGNLICSLEKYWRLT